MRVYISKDNKNGSTKVKPFAKIVEAACRETNIFVIFVLTIEFPWDGSHFSIIVTVNIVKLSLILAMIYIRIITTFKIR